MSAYITLQSMGRPAGAPEFLAYSPKNNGQVRLYCRPSFWRWAETEFNPYITDVLANQVSLNLSNKKISVALQYEMQGVLHLVFSKREVTEGTKNEIIEYCNDGGIKVEVLDLKCKIEQQVHVENLLSMLSYINKHRDTFTDRNLDFTLHAIDRSKGTISNAVRDLQEKYPESAAAMLFELVRRGKVELSDLQCKRIGGATKVHIIRGRHG